MSAMIIDSNNMYIMDKHGQMMLASRPRLGFLYKEIAYNENTKTKVVLTASGIIEAVLEQPDIDAIEAFIANQRAARGIRFMAVDGDGFFLGELDSTDPRISRRVYEAPPNGEDWIFTKDDQWVRAYGFTADGHLVPRLDKDCVGWTLVPPPVTRSLLPYKWSAETQAWHLAEITDEQWNRSVKDEIAVGVPEFLLKALRHDFGKAGIDHRPFMKSVCDTILLMAAEQAKTSPALLRSLPSVQAEVNAVMMSLNEEDLSKVQQSYSDYKEAVASRSGLPISSSTVRVDDLIIDQFIATK